MTRRTQKILIVFAGLLTAAAALTLAIAPERPVRGAQGPAHPAAAAGGPAVTLALQRGDQRLV